MRYRTTFFDLTYDAVFRTPLFGLAGNPVSVLHALHSELSKKYPISSSDMSVDTGRTVADVRARITLFNRNCTVEISAESFSAKFLNPIHPGDMEIVQDVLTLSHGGLSALTSGKIGYREDGAILRMFAELIEEPKDGPRFLRDMIGDHRLFSALVPGKGEMAPGIRFDVLGGEEKWNFQFDVSRAIRNRKEVFVTANMRFFDGGTFTELKQKAEHFGGLLAASMARVGLQPEK